MSLHSALLAVGLVAIAAPAAWAQTIQPPGPTSQGDVAGSVGWFNADKSGIGEYNDWYNRSVFGGASFGWYWTDHLKTEIDTGLSSRVRREVYSYQVVGNLQTIRESTFHFATRRVAVGQHYQFFRNVSFHPYVAAGVDLTWEAIEHEDSQETVYDIQGRRQIETRPRVVHPNRTELHTRPFAGFGFKAYMTPRSFFRSDVKLVFRGGVDEALLRFGFGLDF